MVNKFQNLLNQLKAIHGNVYLFAILQMDEFIDKWSIILSAPWINSSASHAAVFEEIADYLSNNFSSEELGDIARLGIMPKEEHLIQELLKYSSGAVIENQKINGNVVYKGHVLESNLEMGSEKSFIHKPLEG